MKTRTLLCTRRTTLTTLTAFITLAALTGPAQAAPDTAGHVHVHDHARDHAPAHGGIVVEHMHQDFELVAQPTVLRLYARLLGQPTDVSQASAKLMLLSGSTKQEVVLKPAGDHLEATGTFPVAPGTKVVAVVTLNGQPATARFVLK